MQMGMKLRCYTQSFQGSNKSRLKECRCIRVVRLKNYADAGEVTGTPDSVADTSSPSSPTPAAAIENSQIGLPPQGGNIPLSPAADTAAAPEPTQNTDEAHPGGTHNVQDDAVAAYQKSNQDLQKIQAQFQSNHDQLKQQADAFNDYALKNPINPNQYLENMDAGKKTQVGIGLVLGGIGGGILHTGGNVGLDYLNKQIDRNIAAQQANVNNKNTVFGAYKEMYQNDNVAANMAINANATQLANQIKIAGLQDGTPAGMQRAAQAQAFFQNKAQQALGNAAQIVTHNQNNVPNQQNLPGKSGVYSPTPILAPDAARTLQKFKAFKSKKAFRSKKSSKSNIRMQQKEMGF